MTGGVLALIVVVVVVVVSSSSVAVVTAAAAAAAAAAACRLMRMTYSRCNHLTSSRMYGPSVAAAMINTSAVAVQRLQALASAHHHQQQGCANRLFSRAF